MTVLYITHVITDLNCGVVRNKKHFKLQMPLIIVFIINLLIIFLSYKMSANSGKKYQSKYVPFTLRED